MYSLAYPTRHTDYFGYTLKSVNDIPADQTDNQRSAKP